MPLKPGLYLEVGVGANDFDPHPSMLVDAQGNLPPRRFVGGAHYLGIDMPLQPNRSWRGVHGWFLGNPDIDENSVEDRYSIARRLAAARDIVRTLRPGEAIDFAVADALHLPLPDGVAREVYMANVVGSQLRDDVLSDMFSEARRVLRPDGQLVLRECHTGLHIPQDLPHMLSAAGFGSLHLFDPDTPRYAAMVAEYGIHAYEQGDWINPGNFFATADPRSAHPRQSG